MNKKITSKIAFNSGDYVVYPAHGVGKVADITKQKIAGSELELIVVNFDRDKMTLRIPMAKAETTGLRRISAESTMNDALGVLKGKAKVKKVMWSRRAQEYENKINSGNPVAIAEVIRDLYRICSSQLIGRYVGNKDIWESYWIIRLAWSFPRSMCLFFAFICFIRNCFSNVQKRLSYMPCKVKEDL